MLQRSFFTSLFSKFPALGSHYTKQFFKADLLAGITVAMVLIPQSMANAQLAGLPAYHGLYAAMLPTMVAALFGSSRHLTTGTVAVVSLVTAASLGSLAVAGSGTYIAYAVLLALLVGIIQLALGLLRLGLLVNLLSHPVISGFTNASAIIIAASQLGKFFGFTVEQASQQYLTFLHTLQAIPEKTHLPSLLMAVLALFIMWLGARFAPKIPSVLLAVVLTSLLAWSLHFEQVETVPIKAVNWPAARDVINTYTAQQDAIDSLIEERNALAKTLQEAHEAGNDDALAVQVEISHALALHDLALQQAQKSLHNTRLAIQDLQFEVMRDPEGNQHLFSYAHGPATYSKQGNVWRLTLPAGRLNPQQLVFDGGGAVVGTVPAGLPHFALPEFSLHLLRQLFPFACIIALIGFAEAIAIAKSMASKKGYRLDPNRELIGQGLANLAASVTQSPPVSGSFSSSAVNFAAKACTGMSGVFVGLITLFVLLFFTPALYYIPQAVLAAIIMRSVYGLIDLSVFRKAWTAQWYDGMIAAVTFGCTLFFAPQLDIGIAIGVFLSLVIFFYRSMRPKVLSLAPSVNRRSLSVHAFGLSECQHIIVLRFQQSLFFANVDVLEDYVMQCLESMPQLNHMHLSCTSMNDIDSSGETALSLLAERIHKAGVGLSFSGVNDNVRAVLVRTGVMDIVGSENVFRTMKSAICTVYERLQAEGKICDDCPWHVYCAKK